MTKPTPRYNPREPFGKTARDRNEIARLTHRMQALAWWRVVMTTFPGGVVPIDTASRILGVTRSRVYQLIKDGRLPLVEGMPGGTKPDKFIPLDALIASPTAAYMGRPVGYKAGQRYLDSNFHKINLWWKMIREAQPMGKTDRKDSGETLNLNNTLDGEIAAKSPTFPQGR